MALVGGGGAGNVAGSNPAGVGSNLNYVGNLVYAYSGDITLNANLPNPTTLLEFTTGAELYLEMLTGDLIPLVETIPG